MAHISTSLDPTRFNKIGSSGNRGEDSNIADSYNQTFEFNISAQTGFTTFDTGIVLPPHVQGISAMLIVDTAETTGATKTITVGTSVLPNALLLSTTTVAEVTLGQPPGPAFPNPAGNTILVTFGSDDWIEFVGRFIFECKCVR